MLRKQASSLLLIHTAQLSFKHLLPKAIIRSNMLRDELEAAVSPPLSAGFLENFAHRPEVALKTS